MNKFAVPVVILFVLIFIQKDCSQISNPNIYTCQKINYSVNYPLPLPPVMGGYMKPERTDYTGVPADAYFPVMIVFVQFLNDPGPDVDFWHAGQAPNYIDSIIAPIKKYPVNGNWWDTYSNSCETLSDFWLEASRGHFHMVGKAYSVILDHEYTYYQNNGGENRINDDIYQKLNALHSIDWREYDKWSIVHNGSSTYFQYQSDGYVDMIYKVHRSHAPLVGMPAGGICYLYYSLSQGDNYLVDSLHHIYINGAPCEYGSGITLTPGYYGTEGQSDYGSYAPLTKMGLVSFSSHEHGHYLFGLSHQNYGKMSGAGAPYGFDECLSPLESIEMGYLSPLNVNYSDTLYKIGDFSSRNNSTVGEILRVPIHSTNEYFLIASRMKVSKYDKIMCGDTSHGDPDRVINPEYGKGIYIYHVYGGITFPAAVDQECADGLYSWQFAGYQIPDWSTTQQVEYYIKTGVSYNNDKSEGSMSCADGKSIITWFSIGKKNVSLGTDGTDKSFTNKNEVWTSREFQGDRWDAWNIGYNEVFSPYSSPSTKDWSNTNSGIFVWYKNFDSSSNTAQFKIYKAGEGGLTEQDILQMTPPSRPVGLIIIYTECSGNLKYPLLRWNHNMEPDMLNNNQKRQYRIYRADSYDQLVIPSQYIYLTTVFIDNGEAPQFIDTLNAINCISSGMLGGLAVSRYSITAVDTTNWESVKSEFSAIALVDNTIGINLNDNKIPKVFSLNQNYPNPFNPTTKINYQLPITNYVKLAVYDILGREVAILVNDKQNAGSYEAEWNASNFASGVYFYKIQAGDFVSTKRMVLLK